jgi:plastocyanin
MRRGLLTLLLALLLAAPAQAATKTVVAGAPAVLTHELPATDVDRYFRRVITIHTGDTVRWLFHDAHTVTFPGGDGKVPAFVVPDPLNPYRGYSDLAGKPYWFDGFPALALNPALLARTPGGAYDGTELRNSGFDPARVPAPYQLHFTRPGTYTYYCLLHPGRHGFIDGMRGTVRVLAAGKPIPGVAADRLAAQREWNSALRTARVLAKAPARGATVYAGRAQGGAELLRFFPQLVRVRAGATVTFAIAPRSVLFHTVSFGPRALLRYEADHQFQRRGAQLLASPTTFLGTEPLSLSLGPPLSFTGPVASYPAATHAGGFLSLIGMDIDQTSPNPESVRVRFTRPGRYRFFCLIHYPLMYGVVDVAG